MTQIDEKEAKAEAAKARSADMKKREKELNAGKSGVGPRFVLTLTRGKNPTEVKYEAFDEDDVATLPKTIEEFMTITELDPAKDESKIVSLLIGGFNDAAYTSASDPLAEFIEPHWTDDAKAQFRLVVRNYSRGALVSIDDAVALIKPGFEKQYPAPSATV